MSALSGELADRAHPSTGGRKSRLLRATELRSPGWRHRSALKGIPLTVGVVHNCDQGQDADGRLQHEVEIGRPRDYQSQTYQAAWRGNRRSAQSAWSSFSTCERLPCLTLSDTASPIRNKYTQKPATANATTPLPTSARLV